jgi:heme exporter protein C
MNDENRTNNCHEGATGGLSASAKNPSTGWQAARGTPSSGFASLARAGEIAALLLLLAAILAIFRFAPTEQTMGDVQRIVYVHVPSAWLGLAGFLVMSATGAMYLWRRQLHWDHWSQAAAELAWLFCSLALVTGSCWARAAWNTWWPWDPRLTTYFILWACCSGCLLLRGSIDNARQRARMSAVLAIVGTLDIPLVILATRWFRGMHPSAPRFDPAMRGVLLLSVLAFTGLFALLLARRQSQLHLESRLEALEDRLMENGDQSNYLGVAQQ